MESHYSINVSFNGRHLFATAPRSAITRVEATKLFWAIRTRFAEADGFEVSVTYWVGAGTNLTEEFLKEEK